MHLCLCMREPPLSPWAASASVGGGTGEQLSETLMLTQTHTQMQTHMNTCSHTDSCTYMHTHRYTDNRCAHMH